jgi:hypothetical protein
VEEQECLSGGQLAASRQVDHRHIQPAGEIDEYFFVPSEQSAVQEQKLRLPETTVEVRDDADIPREVEIDHMTVAPYNQVDSVGGTRDAVQQAVATAGLIGQRRIYEVDYLGHGDFFFYIFPVAKSNCRNRARHRLATKLWQCPASEERVGSTMWIRFGSPDIPAV